jgi:LCP family protein required for cell wall assembly
MIALAACLNQAPASIEQQAAEISVQHDEPTSAVRAQPASNTPVPPSATPKWTSTPYPTVTPTPVLRYLSPLDAGTPLPVGGLGEIVNILLIGSDSLSRETQRTDSLILVSIQPAYRLVTLLSIPRDLYVSMPRGHAGRINGAFQIGEREGYPGGGFSFLGEVLQQTFGIEIDFVAMLDFDGFRQGINLIGGLEVPLSCSFTDWRLTDPTSDPETEANWALHTIGPGPVHMDGDLALWFVRSRIRSSDFDRGRRQQILLRAAYQKGLDLELLVHLPELFEQLRDTVQTDLELMDLLRLSPLSLDVSGARIRSYYLIPPYVTSHLTEAGSEVLLPNPGPLAELFAEVFGPPDSDEIRTLATKVEIWNWSPHAGFDLLARERLEYAGYSVNLVPGITDDAQKTLLFRLNPDQPSASDEALLKLLNLEADQFRIDVDAEAASDYRLIIGADFSPCYDRLEIER